jgi:hypothetical protein
MRRISLVLIWIVAVALALPAVAAADPVQLAIRDGRVTLVAANASVKQILAEWARIGRTRIVNGERVPGGLVTLQLTNVPEREALDLLLRTAAGYIAAPRAVGVSDGSVFDRILILPTSATPPSTALRQPTRAPVPAPIFQQPPQPQPAPVFVPPGAQRVLGPDGQPVPDDQDETSGAPRPQPYVPLPPGFSEPPDPRTRPATPGASPRVPAGVPVPGMVVPAPAQPNGPREVQPRVAQ